MSTVEYVATSLLIPVDPDDRDDLLPATFPAADVLAGDPQSRYLPLSSPGEGISVWLWDCTPGRFAWHYPDHEVVHIIEGDVTVTDQDGGTTHLGPGSVASFSAGTSATWEVHGYVRKVAVTHQLPADKLSRLARGLRAVLRRALRR